MKRYRRPLGLGMLVVGALMVGCQQQDASTREDNRHTPARRSDDAAREPDHGREIDHNREPANQRNSARRPLMVEPRTDESQAAREDREPQVSRRESEPKKLTPHRPESTWVIFREAVVDQDDVSYDAEWRGGNHFDIRTQNIRRMTIDMSHLPPKAPTKGPWVLNIDGQGVELTGFTPKPGYTGHKRDLVRSKNGVWEVDKQQMYRVGE